MSGGKGGSTPAGNTTTTQNTSPWSAQQPYLEQAMAQAQNLFQNYTPQYYPAATLAPVTGDQISGLSSTVGTAENLMSGADPSLYATDAALTGLESGGLLAGNPAFGTLNNIATGGLNSDVANAIKAQVQPGITAQFVN